MDATVFAWSPDHTYVIVLSGGLYYHFQSGDGSPLDFDACMSAVSGATAAAVNSL